MYMGLLDTLSENITAKGREVTEKAKGLAEIASLRSQIATCEDVIRKSYTEIGKLYYEQFQDTEENLYGEQSMAISNARHAIEELEAKIKEIKGV